MLSHRDSNRNLEKLGKQKQGNRADLESKTEELKNELEAARKIIAKLGEAVRGTGRLRTQSVVREKEK